MSPTAPAPPLPAVEGHRLSTFDGGVNYRDAPSEVAPNETPDAMNVTADPRGGVVKRLGHSKMNASGMAGVSQNGFYWEFKQKVIVQIGAVLYKTSDFITFTSFKTFSTTDLVGMCEFQTFVVIAHPVDGVWTYDDAAMTQRNATVKGNCCAAWQNYALVAGDPSNPARLWKSAKGDPTSWTTATDFNDLREKDNALITAMGAGQGVDIAGRPGLLVFKEESAYRVYDSGTLAFATIDAAHGCSGPLGLTSAFGLTCAINKHGIFVTDGVNALRDASGKVAPLFRANQLNLSKMGLAAAGFGRDTVRFSLPLIGSNVNSLELEFHPTQGWILPHTFPAAWYARYEKADDQLLKGSPSVSYIYKAFSGGSDDGAAIASRFQTHWIVPASGYNCRFHRARVHGRGAINTYTRLDYDIGQGELQTLDIGGAGALWNTHDWNDGTLWGPQDYEGTNDLWRLGCGRAISLVFEETSTLTANAPALMRSAQSPTVGAWALSEILLEFSRLGRA